MLCSPTKVEMWRVMFVAEARCWSWMAGPKRGWDWVLQLIGWGIYQNLLQWVESGCITRYHKSQGLPCVLLYVWLVLVKFPRPYGVFASYFSRYSYTNTHIQHMYSSTLPHIVTSNWFLGFGGARRWVADVRQPRCSDWSGHGWDGGTWRDGNRADTAYGFVWK